MQLQILTIVFLICVAAFVEAQGNGNGRGNRVPGQGRGGRGRGKGRRGPFVRLPNSERYSWERELSNDVTTNETAIVMQKKDVALFMSRDGDLSSQNISRSITIYDYTSGTGVVATRLLERGSPCYILSTNESRTFEELVGEFDRRNSSDSAVMTNQTETLSALSSPLPRQEAVKMFRGSKGLRRFCGFRRNIFVAEPFEGDASRLADVGRVKALTVDSLVTLIFGAFFF